MLSRLIISPNPQQGLELATNLKDQLTSQANAKSEFKVIQPEGTKITIKQIRSLQSEITITPPNGTITTYIINPAKHLSIPAQQALLKIVEEPPPYALIIFICQHKSELLPTILSRTIIHTTPFTCPLTPEQLEEYAQKQSQLLKQKPITRLTHANKSLNDRDTLSEHIMQLIYLYHAQLVKIQSPQTSILSHNLKTLIRTSRFIQANGNTTLALDLLNLKLHNPF